MNLVHLYALLTKHRLPFWEKAAVKIVQLVLSGFAINQSHAVLLVSVLAKLPAQNPLTANVLIHIPIKISEYIPVCLETQNIGNAYTMSE